MDVRIGRAERVHHPVRGSGDARRARAATSTGCRRSASQATTGTSRARSRTASMRTSSPSPTSRPASPASQRCGAGDRVEQQAQRGEHEQLRQRLAVGRAERQHHRQRQRERERGDRGPARADQPGGQAAEREQRAAADERRHQQHRGPAADPAERGQGQPGAGHELRGQPVAGGVERLGGRGDQLVAAAADPVQLGRDRSARRSPRSSGRTARTRPSRGAAPRARTRGRR